MQTKKKGIKIIFKVLIKKHLNICLIWVTAIVLSIISVIGINSIISMTNGTILTNIEETAIAFLCWCQIISGIFGTIAGGHICYNYIALEKEYYSKGYD